MEEDAEVRSHGCLMIRVERPDWMDRLHGEISGYDLLRREDDPHVTLFYGFDRPIGHRVGDIVDVIRSEIPDRLHLEAFPSLFRNDTSDVLKLSVTERSARSLRRLNRALKVFPHTSTYDYSPHLTIAYLVSGTGSLYTKLFVEKPYVDVVGYAYNGPGEEKRYIYR